MQQMNSLEPCPMLNRECASMDSSGRCCVLRKIRYSQEMPCPFYKTKEQVQAENTRTLVRLAVLGRIDLLIKYHNPKKANKSGPGPAISRSTLRTLA